MYICRLPLRELTNQLFDLFINIIPLLRKFILSTWLYFPLFFKPPSFKSSSISSYADNTVELCCTRQKSSGPGNGQWTSINLAKCFGDVLLSAYTFWVAVKSMNLCKTRWAGGRLPDKEVPDKKFRTRSSGQGGYGQGFRTLRFYNSCWSVDSSVKNAWPVWPTWPTCTTMLAYRSSSTTSVGNYSWLCMLW